MLTKSDFSAIEKLVRGVVREEVENESQAIKDDLGGEISMSRMRLEEGIDQVKNRVKNVEIRVGNMHKDLRKEIKLVSNVLDKQTMRTIKRVDKIEQHLGFSPQTA